MTSREYLEQIAFYDKRINIKETKLKQLWARYTKTTSAPDKEPIQSSGISDKVGNGAVEIATLNNEIARLKAEKQKRLDLIESVTKPLDYAILYGKYIDQKKLVDIAQEENYSYQYVKERHIAALEGLKIPK